MGPTHCAIALLFAAACSNPETVPNDGGAGESGTSDAAVDAGSVVDAAADAPVDATKTFCSTVDASFCADFDQYPYIMTLDAFGQGDASLVTTSFVSPPQSAHFWAPAGKNGAFTGQGVQGVGTHLQVELDLMLSTSGLTTPVELLRFSVSQSGSTRNFEYVITSAAAELDVGVFADGGIGPTQPVPATLPPLGAWTHVTFDADCVQNGTVSLAFDGTTAVTYTGDLSLPGGNATANFGFNADAQDAQDALSVSVEAYLDDVVIRLTP